MEVTTQEKSSPGLRPLRRKYREKAEDASIKSRLTWTVAIPWIVVLIIWAISCSVFAFDAVYTRQIAVTVREVSLPAVSALEAVQRERQLSMDAVSRGLAGTPELDVQQNRTDQSLDQLEDVIDSVLRSAPDEVRRPLDRLSNYFDELPEMRSRIASRSVSPTEVGTYYNGLFDAATVLFDTQARVVRDTDSMQGALAATSLFRASDLFAREAAIVNAALNSGQVDAERYRELVNYIGAYRLELQNSSSHVVPEVRQAYRQLTDSAEWKQVRAAEDAILAHGVWNQGNPPVDPAQWRQNANEVQEKLAQLVRHQAGLVSAQTVESGSQTMWTVLWGSLLTLALAGVSFFFTSRLYRSVVDEALLTRLRGLRNVSLEMARRLPELVNRIREGKHVDVEQETSSLQHYGNDEIGQVAHAIRTFQQEAVEAAVGESRARQGARVVFVGMARRIQRLLRQMHGTIDVLERNEENSGQLARLYELDNSTTRARRTVENLLVLGDQQPGRRWSKPVPLMDVLRSAISEIDQYSRVVLGHVPDIAVSGAAVGDTIHLISELIDNATAFSPPHTQVHVDATEVARGVAIDIADQGLGMSEEDRARANRMMSDPPEFDRLVLENNKAEQLGLFTAARLAERRDVHVEFGVSAYGGTRATVLLPDRILENPEPEQDQPEPEPVPAMPRQREHGWSGQVLSVASVPKPSTDDTTATKARETVWPPAEPPVEPAASEPERPQPPQPEQRQEASQQSGEDSQASSPKRPPLPKRVPQTHLAEGLREEPDPEEQSIVASPSRLASFRRAFKGGFENRPEDRS